MTQSLPTIKYFVRYIHNGRSISITGKMSDVKDVIASNIRLNTIDETTIFKEIYTYLHDGKSPYNLINIYNTLRDGEKDYKEIMEFFGIKDIDI